MKRLVYISRFAQPMPPAEIAILAANAARRNEAADITGVLMSAGGLFFQVLEGPDAAIDALFATIREDERHIDVTLLSEERAITSRRFPRWSMARLIVDDESRRRLAPLHALLEALLASQQQVSALSKALQDAAWAALE